MQTEIEYFLPGGKQVTLGVPELLASQIDEHDDGYSDSDELTHVRIYNEESGDEFDWWIDAVDCRTGRYSEDVWRFASREKALEQLQLFVSNNFGSYHA